MTVTRFKGAEETGVTGGIRCLRIDDLEAHLESLPTLITTNLQPDLIIRDATLVPVKTAIPV